MNKLVILIAVSLTFSFGCARTLVSMKEECSAYGFKEGSDKYGECMMTLSQRDIDRRQKISDSIRDLTKAPESSRQPQQPIPNHSMHCTSSAFGNTIKTDCDSNSGVDFSSQRN